MRGCGAPGRLADHPAEAVASCLFFFLILLHDLIHYGRRMSLVFLLGGLLFLVLLFCLFFLSCDIKIFLLTITAITALLFYNEQCIVGERVK